MYSLSTKQRHISYKASHKSYTNNTYNRYTAVLLGQIGQR